MLESLVTAVSVGAIATPVAAAAQGLGTAAIAYILIDALTDQDIFEIIAGWRDDYRAHQESPEGRAEHEERAHSLFGGIRNVFNTIIDALTGGPIDRFQRRQEEENI